MLKFLREIRQTLPPAYKYAAAGLAAMMVVSALLELAALALVMPVASALAAPELLEKCAKHVSAHPEDRQQVYAKTPLDTFTKETDN